MSELEADEERLDEETEADAAAEDGMIADDDEADVETSNGNGEATEARQRVDSIVESVLFAAGAPLPLRRLVDVLNGPTAKEIKESIERLVRDYEGNERGIHLVAVAGGFQFRTAPENAEWVRALLRERPARLGRATLETLAIIAYKQPATRAEIEAVRGVDADSAISSLLAKRLIKIAGRKETVGRPLMYTTTADFLEVFGLKDINELPALKEIGPVAEPENEAGSEDDVESAGAPSEDHEPRRDQLAADGGGTDPGGQGVGERPGGDGARDEGGPESGQDLD
jgi:segregation and condensation protein B